MKRGAYRYVAVLATIILFTFAFLSLDLPAGPTGLQTFETEAISACGNVTASDNLTSSISSTGTCLNITASNVDLNCNGNTITYNTADGTGFFGIRVVNQTNITIRNCRIVYSGTAGTISHAIRLESVNDSVIRNNTLITTGDDDNDGVHIEGDSGSAGRVSRRNIIYNNTINIDGDGTGDGIHLATASSHTLIENNTIGLHTNETGGFSCCGAGVQLSDLTGAMTNNTVRGNNINGSAANGLIVQAINESTITNNVFDASGFTLNAVAIFSAAMNGTRVQNNTIRSFNATQDNQFGVVLSASLNFLFEGNTIITYGQDANYGIKVDTGTANVTVANNTIRTNGRRTNRGIYLNSVITPNIYVGNSIFTNGTDNIANPGILADSSRLQQILRNNISTNSTANSPGNPGIDLSASSNNIIDGNTILANGTITGSNGNPGIVLRSVSDANSIVFNTVRTDGTGNNNTGIRLANDADSNNVTSNVIFTNGGSLNYGISLNARLVIATPGGGGGCAGFEGNVQAASQAHTNSVSNNNVSRNIIRTNGTVSHGIVLESATVTITEGSSTEGFQGNVQALSGTRNNSVTDNLIAENTIIANGTQSNGIQLIGISSTNNATNNSVRNNNITTLGGNSFGIGIDTSSGTEFNNTLLNNSVAWINNSAGSSNGLQNTTFARDFGSIRLNGTILFSTAFAVLRDHINITNNTAFLNSSALPSVYNTTGFITLYNLTFAAITLYADFADNGTFFLCGANCTLASYTGGTAQFNVSHFTTFTTQSAGGVNISLTKADSPDPVNAGSQLNYTILINVTAGTAVNITVNETYPSQVTFHNSSPSPSVGNNFFSLGNLTAGQTFQVNITVNVSASAGGNVINNTVNITYANSTGTSFNLTATENTTVNTVPTNVTVTKTDSPDPVNNGSTLRYTINITVSGANATNVTLTETYPSSVTFNGSQPTPTSGNNTFSLPNISAGQSFLVNITVNVSASASGTLTNNVTVNFTNTTGGANTANASESTTVNVTAAAGAGSSGSGGGSGGGGGSGVCYPICRQPGYETLPQCSACPPIETLVEPPVQQPAYVSEPAQATSRPSSYIPESEGYPQQPQRYVPPQIQTPQNVSALAKYSWLWLLLLIALIVYLATRKSTKLDKMPAMKMPPMPTFSMPKFKTPSMFKPRPEPKIDTSTTLSDLKDYENKLRQLREQLKKIK